MFSSVSGCVPNSRIRLSFVSSVNQELGITPEVIVYVGIAQIIVRPVVLVAGDVVEIELDTPPGYLGYRFYEYTLNDVPHAFAVVNGNDYRPTLKPNDAPRKWFNYFPKEIRTSFYDVNGSLTRPLGRGVNFVNIDTTHVVLDHIKERVNFYSPSRELVTSVKLPTGPVEYKKADYIDANNIPRVELYVICNDKKLYRIRFDNQFSEGSEFFPTVTFIRSLELIWYEADLPTGESYIDNRRNSLRSKVNPPMTGLDVFGGLIWAAGYDTVYVLNKSFQTLATIRIQTESIVSISCLTETTAYAVTRLGKIYQVTAAGSYTMFYDAARPLGVPARVDMFDSTPVIVVPDPHHQRLLKITGPVPPVLANSIQTPGHAPAYARVFDDSLLITSYDNNEVLRYTDWNTQYVYEFDEKVTIASWVKDKADYTLLAVHYLKDFVTLDLTDIEKVIPVKIKPLKGPLTHIGSEPVKLIMLGQEGIPLHAGPGLTYWINGIKYEPAGTGDNFSISYKAIGIGLHRTAYILGDRAYDIDVEVIGEAEYLRSYNAGSVGINRLSTLSNVSSITLPTVGDAQTGTTLLNLDLTWNFFGNSYTQINVSTNGYISFGSGIPTGPYTTLGGMNIDALYVEPDDLYQGLALNNTDPTNITFFPLSTGENPAVYYQSGSVLDFKFARIRWVGIKGYPDPNGNVITARTTLISSTDIPSVVSEFTKASPGDYVSGTGIVLPTRVVGNTVTQIFDFSIYKLLPGGRILVTSYTSNVLSVIKYSAINGSAIYVTSASQLLQTKTGYRPNHLLEIFDNTAIIDGSIDPSVTIEWAMRIPTFGAAPNFVYQTGITSIVETTNTITCLGTYTEFDGNGNVSLVDPQRMFVSSLDFDLINVNQTLLGIPVGSMHVVSKQIVGNSRVISTSSNHSLATGSTFDITKTTITTSTDMPTLANDGVALDRTVSFELSSLIVSTVSGLAPGDITVQGVFITVDTPVSIVTGTTITFKSDIPPDEYMYEVGLYQNNKYQFIEYFYDNTAHSATSNIGMSTGYRLTGKRILSNTAPAGTSIVYYSEIGTGIFRPLGLGSFDFYSTPGIVAPKISKGVIKSDYDYTVEFYVDQDLTPQSNVYLSASYGLLQLNGSKYITNNPIKKNDLIQLTTPFNRALRAIAPILSLGDSQFPIPMIASAAIGTLTRYDFLTDNLPNNSIVSVSLTVPASDYYYIPELYRYGFSIFPDITYVITRAGNTITLDSGYTYDLFVGDQLTISNILTSKVSADTRDIVLIGQNTAIVATVKTSGPPLVDYLSFDTLIQPYTDNYYYNFSNISAPSPYVEELTGYVTANILLTANSGVVTANLYIEDVNTNFVINGVQSGNYVTNVPVGSNISIHRSFVDYFQSNVVIYQVEFDSFANGNIYLPVGQWNVDNKVINGGDFLQNNILAAGLQPQLGGNFSSFNFELTPRDTDPTMFELGTVLSFAARPTTFALDRLVERFVPISTYQTFSTKLKFLEQKTTDTTFSLTSLFTNRNVTYLLINPTYENFLKSNYLELGSISYQYKDAGNYYPTDSIQGDLYNAALFFTDRIQSNYADNPSEIYVSGISGEVNPDTTFSLLSIESDLIKKYSISESETAAKLFELFVSVDNKFVFDLEKIITVFESGLGTDTEDSYSFNTIDMPEAVSGIVGNYGSLALQISTWERSFNYLSAATQSDLEKLIEFFNGNFESMSLDQHSEFSSIIENQFEHRPTIFNDRIRSAFLKKIQDMQSDIQSLKEKIQSEFRGETQSSYQHNNAVLEFTNESMLNLLKTELIFSVVSEKLKQSWTDAPQFDFDRILPQIEQFQDLDPENYSPNLIWSDDERAKLIDHATEMIMTEDPTMVLFSELIVPLTPLVKAFSLLNIPFTPLRDLPPVYFIPFDPLLNQPLELLIPFGPRLNQPSELLIPLTLMLDIVPEQIIPFDPVLFRDIVWTMEDSIPNVGAISTYIHYWADQGQFNDKWNLREYNTTNYTRAYNPMVVYTKEYTYGPGGFVDDGSAEDEKVKYYNAGIIQIPGTDFWNYRIYFKDRHFCVPRKGRIFPVTWYIRGG